MAFIEDYIRVFQPVVLMRIDGESADDLVSQMGEVRIKESTKHNTQVEVEFPIASFGFEDSPGTLGQTPFDFRNTLLDDPRLQPGALWDLRWGYFDDISPTLSVIVTHFSPRYPQDGNVSITVYAQSKGVTVGKDTRAQNWGRVQSSEIANQIAQRYGLNPNTEDSNDARSRAFMQPAGVSDMEFLQRLARRIRFVCYVESGVLHFHRPDMESAPALELTYYTGDPNSILQAFYPEVKQIPRRRTKQQGSSDEDNSSEEDSASDDTQNSLGTDIPFDATARHWWVEPGKELAAENQPTPEVDQKARQRVAQSRQRDLLERVNKAKAEAIGTPRLRRDTNVKVLGVGPQMSGVWHVRESTHILGGGGYRVTMNLRRGAVPHVPRKQGSDVEETQGNDQDAVEAKGQSNGAIFVDANDQRIHVKPRTEAGPDV